MVLGGTDILSSGQARVRGSVGHLRIIETNPTETNVRRASPREAVDRDRERCRSRGPSRPPCGMRVRFGEVSGNGGSERPAFPAAATRSTARGSGSIDGDDRVGDQGGGGALVGVGRGV
jgi:hypothetical protein